MIKFQNVHKTYENSGVDALRGVSFLIDEGEFVFIIGKSGSGKSTILKCMNCEERPNEGTVSIDGFCISDMSRALVPVLRRHIGMIFQDFRLIETKTVAENISYAGEIIGLSRKSLHQKVQLVLNIVGLKDKSDAYPLELSGGEQQRVAIARAMLNNPKIIIADEPTGNLDPATSENIMGLLLDINRSGTTVIVCTHDANMVDRMKKRVIEIENGLVVRDKEDSAYSDAINDTASDSDFDEEVYIPEKPPVGDFYFGETPASVASANAAAAQAAKAAAAAAASAASFGDDDGYDDEEVAFGDELTDISDLPVENEEEPAEEEPEVQALPENKPVSLPASVTESAPDSGAPESVQESITESSKEASDSEAPAPQISETSVVTSSDETVEEDDSWLKEVRMDDIDLDIQEDDE